MVGWIVLGVCVGSLLVLALVAAGTAGRLRGLNRAVRRAQLRREDLTKTQAKMADLQATADLVVLRSARTSEHLAMLKAARASGEPAHDGA
jgi:hypothetical protein